MPSSRGSSQLRNQTYVSCVFCTGRQFFTTSSTPGRSTSQTVGLSRSGEESCDEKDRDLLQECCGFGRKAELDPIRDSWR